MGRSWRTVCRRAGRKPRPRRPRRAQVASLTAACAIYSTLCHQDQAANQPLSSPEPPTQNVEGPYYSAAGRRPDHRPTCSASFAPIGWYFSSSLHKEPVPVFPMTILRNEKDRNQVVMAFIGPVIMVMPIFYSFGFATDIISWLVVWFCLCRQNYILHNHVHHPFTKSRLLNRVLSGCLAFCTGMTAGCWKITHVHGHHVEHKLESLPSRRYVQLLEVDPREKPSFGGAFRHALRTTPIQWGLPLYIMIRRSLSPRCFRRKFYTFHLREFVCVYGVAFTLFYMHPERTFFFVFTFYALVHIISRYVDYTSHIGSDTSSQFGFANICTNTIYNRLYWNFGFHVAHHMSPRAHWTELPTLYSQMEVMKDHRVNLKRANVLGLFRPYAFTWHRVVDTERSKDEH